MSGDKLLTQLNSLTSPSPADLLYAVKASGSEQGKVTFEEVAGTTSQTKYIATQVDKTNITLSSLTDLSFNVLEGRIYKFDLTLFIVSNTTGGIRFDMAGGSATISSSTYYSIQIFSADGSSSGVISTFGNGLTTSPITNGASTYTVKIDGIIIIQQPGTFVPRFAQKTATGTSSVLVGSPMTVTLVG